MMRSFAVYPIMSNATIYKEMYRLFRIYLSGAYISAKLADMVMISLCISSTFQKVSVALLYVYMAQCAS
jgi:hypothetical protein